MALVTLQQVKTHLRITNGDQDEDLEMKLDQATALVVLYLKRTDLGSPDPEPADADPTDLTPIERAIVQAAILEVVANLDRFRGDDPDGENPNGVEFLTPSIRGRLSMLRDPALA